MLDPGVAASRRAVTSAVPMPGADNATDAFFSPLDVAGYNYAFASYERDHQRVPDRIIVATETFPARSVDDWRAQEAHSFVIGTFIWTAIDYIGESAIGANGHYEPSSLACGSYCAQPYPYHISFCGDLDLMGEPKAQSRLRRVMWNVSALEMAVQRPGVEVIGAWGFRDEQQTWTWPGLPANAAAMTVRAYGSSGCVVLSLNGQVIPGGVGGVGQEERLASEEYTDLQSTAITRRRRRSRRLQARRLQHIEGAPPHCVDVSPDSDFTVTWHVGYQPGELRATRYASTAPQPLESIVLTTAGPPSRIILSVDQSTLRASRDDLTYVTATIVDSKGLRVQCGMLNASASTTAASAARTVLPQEQKWAWPAPTAPNGGDENADLAEAPGWCAPSPIRFEVVGAAELAAVGTGSPTDLGSFAGPVRHSYRGLATAIVRPGKTGNDGVVRPGMAHVTASAPGLQPATLVLEIIASEHRSTEGD